MASCGMLFSIIVPFLNEERWLPGCLDALDAQTLDRSLFELIFVDNGSTDRSVEIVTTHGGVRLLHEPQRDPYLARNRGIAAACARQIVFRRRTGWRNSKPRWRFRRRQSFSAI
jgi:glycosyltransferase involved in cell wall biosynthesis